MADMKVNEHLWQAYSDPYFQFFHPWSCDAFAIITAWNPASVWLSEIDNAIRNKELARDLIPYNKAKAWVGNQDFSWKEESFAVALDLDKAIELGIRYQQNAIYYVVGENVGKKQLFLISCLEDRTRLALGEFHHRCF